MRIGLGPVGLSGLSGSSTTTATAASLSGTAFHPIFREPLRFEVHQVGDDPDEQVGETIQLMRRYAMEDSASTEIRETARQIRSEAGDDDVGATCRVWEETRGRIGFLRDEAMSRPLDGFLAEVYGGSPVIEVLVRPRDMATMRYARYGDCDDFSMYAASLLAALGIPCSFVTLAGDDKQPRIFSHVYVAAYPGGERIALDASHGEYCGWEAPKPWARKKEWPVLGDQNEGEYAWAAWLAALAAAGFLAWTVAGAK